MENTENRYRFNMNDGESIGKAMTNFQEDNPTMDINAPHGTKVIYTGKGGTDNDKIRADEYLKIGYEYTVEDTQVEDWSTKVHLQEVQDKWQTGVRVYFNSVMFKNA